MILEVHERLALLQLLPSKGDYAALKTIRRAREMLTFAPEEQKALEMNNTTNAAGVPQVNWNPSKTSEVVKDCPIDEYTTNLFRDALADLNKKGELTEQTISLYEKFVVMYQ